MSAPGEPPAPAEARRRVGRMMDDHWRERWGYTVPHATVYPWLWLWDSCFHAVVWAALGRGDRAGRELTTALAGATGDGFVPHMTYAASSDHHRDFWGVGRYSTITQPPLYGHALAVLSRAGIDVGHLVGPVTAALHHLLEGRMTDCGLLRIVHPWENGTDDSPRWGPWQTDPFDAGDWWRMKGRLVAALQLDGREAVGSSAFAVCPAGWNALVAWNAAEVAAVTGDPTLAAAARRLAGTLDQVSWDAALGTWVDVDPAGRPTSRVRTLDGLLGVLVTPDAHRADGVLDAVMDPGGYGTPFGPSGVHPAEASYAPDTYWRGGSWPPLDYLLRTAADRRRRDAHAEALDRALRRGAWASGLAEYRHPTTGAGLGAVPQSWAGLAVVPRLLASPPVTLDR